MTDGRGDVVILARAWIGTPYVHQCSCLEGGADCLGLMRGVWRGLFGSEPELVPPYSPDWSEAQGDERLWAAARRHLLEKADGAEAPGDVLLFRMRSAGVAKHLGIVGEVGAAASFIHAYSGRGVVESSLSEPWRRKIVARFAFPEGR